MKKVYCDICGTQIVETLSFDDFIGGKIIFTEKMKPHTESFDACSFCFSKIKHEVEKQIWHKGQIKEPTMTITKWIKEKYPNIWHEFSSKPLQTIVEQELSKRKHV